jgi:hypothetical protein
VWGYVVEEVAVLIDEGVAEALLYPPQQLLELRCPFLGKGFAVEAQGIIPQGIDLDEIALTADDRLTIDLRVHP